MELDSEIIENRPFRRVSSGSLALHHDPVGNHIIELREYYRTLEQKLQERKELSKQNSSERAKKRKIQKQNFPIPKFPKHYPFSHLMKPLPESNRKLRYLKYNGVLPRFKETRITFIEKVLLQTGFCLTQTRNETVLVEYLSNILDEFLEKFVNRLLYNKRSEPSPNSGQDLLGPLETTLRNFGIGGVSALHTFYYENVARKHDILYRKCEDLYIKYRDNVERL